MKTGISAVKLAEMFIRSLKSWRVRSPLSGLEWLFAVIWYLYFSKALSLLSRAPSYLVVAERTILTCFLAVPFVEGRHGALSVEQSIQNTAIHHFDQLPALSVVGDDWCG